MPYKPNPATQCQYRSQLNRRCRLPFAPDHPTLCAFHARAARRAQSTQHAQAIAAEILAGTENFSTPARVNLFLGSLLKNFANHQISRRDATTMAYISQLLLNSQCVMHRQAQDAQAAKPAAPQRIVIDVERPNYDDPPTDPIATRGHSGETSPSPNEGRNSVSATTSASLAPTPDANKIPHNPDDHDPPNNAQPLPNRRSQPVYGFSNRHRRHHFHTAHHHSFTLRSVREGPLLSSKSRLVAASALTRAVATSRPAALPCGVGRLARLRLRHRHSVAARHLALSATLLDCAAAQQTPRQIT